MEEKLLKDREGPDFLETEHIEIKYTLKIRDNFYFTFSAYSGEKVAEDENNPRKDMIQKGLAIDIDCYSTYDTENIKLDSNFIEKELPVFLNRSSQTAKTIIQNIQSSKG
ncbi:MAG: hypothetical protein M1521_06750 [Thermotogae bacterium]|nr:hypothetical protein [Thermotogota bacterium]